MFGEVLPELRKSVNFVCLFGERMSEAVERPRVQDDRLTGDNPFIEKHKNYY